MDMPRPEQSSLSGGFIFLPKQRRMYDNIKINDGCPQNELNFDFYYGIPIITPRASISFQVRNMTETYIRSKNPPKQYDNPETINSLIKDVFSFLDEQINVLTQRLSSKELIFILLCEYSKSSSIQEIFAQDNSTKESDRWKERNTFRRSIKYLAEKMLEYFDDSRIVRSSNFAIEIELMIELTEIAFDFSIQSASIHGIGRGNACFELYEPQPTPFNHYYDFHITGFNYEIFEKAHYLYRNFIENNRPLYDNIIADYESSTAKIIDDKNCAYFNYFIKIFDILRKIGTQSNYVYIPKNTLKIQIIENNIPADCADLFFDTFSINKDGLRKQPRKIYATKQSYRLKIRFMVEIEESETQYLFYTEEMRREGYILFQKSLCYNDPPIELQSEKLKKECAKISRSYGKKFEQYANKFLTTKGFYGKNCKRRIPSNILIPNVVGEIDFLGYSLDHKRIACFEFKNTFYSTDPLEYRDELDKYIFKKDSYLNKFKKKVEFIRANIKSLVDYYRQHGSIDLSDSQLIVGILTYAPNISRFFMSEYKCMSLAEFEYEWEHKPEQFTITA